MSNFVQQNATICDFGTTDSWVILSPIEQSIKSKIEAVGTPLKDWDIQINYGIKTGLNDAFIISTEKRNEILDNCSTEEERQKTAELIRPILRGRDIKRYSYDWANLWLIWIPWHFPMHLDKGIEGASHIAEEAFMQQYPAVYNHLLQYKKELSSRNKAETGIRYEWYAMQRWGANYWEDFNKPKIVYREIGVEMDACLLPPDFIINNKLYLMTGENLSYLLAFFNSSIFNKIIMKFANTTGGKGADFMYNIKVPTPTTSILQIVSLEDYACNMEAQTKVEYILCEIYNFTSKEQEWLLNNC